MNFQLKVALRRNFGSNCDVTAVKNELKDLEFLTRPPLNLTYSYKRQSWDNVVVQMNLGTESWY